MSTSFSNTLILIDLVSIVMNASRTYDMQQPIIFLNVNLVGYVDILPLLTELRICISIVLCQVICDEGSHSTEKCWLMFDTCLHNKHLTADAGGLCLYRPK